MFEFKDLDDINNYYINKGIEPYWKVFKNNGWIKLEHIQIVTERFNYLLNLYPDLKINGLGDSYTFSMDYYKKNKDMLELREPTYKLDSYGYRYDKDKDGKNIDINAYFKPYFNVILIVHNSRLLRENINLNEQLSNTLTHEFGHALDNQYKITENPLFIDFYDKNKNFIIQSIDLIPKPIEEFMAIIFENSFHKNVVKVKEGKVLIDEIINSTKL